MISVDGWSHKMESIEGPPKCHMSVPHRRAGWSATSILDVDADDDASFSLSAKKKKLYELGQDSKVSRWLGTDLAQLACGLQLQVCGKRTGKFTLR